MNVRSSIANALIAAVVAIGLLAVPAPAAAQSPDAPPVMRTDAPAWSPRFMSRSYDRRLTLRATIFTGYPDVLSLGVSWDRPSPFSLEGGIWGNPIGGYPSTRAYDTRGCGDFEELADQCFEDERIDPAIGLYFRPGLNPVLKDTRGYGRVPMSIHLPIQFDLRTNGFGSNWAFLMGWVAGVELVFWGDRNQGVSLHATIGSPFVEFRSFAFLGLEPWARLAIGWVF